MNSLVRTEQIWMNLDDVISSLCHFSKNLWNEANYAVRQEFINNHIWIRYNTLAGTFKTSENFKSIKEWSKHPEKFLGRPKLPNYKPKDGEALLVFTNQQVSIKDGYLLFPKNLQLQPIKTRLGDDSKLREVRIIPKGVGYVCEIVYEKNCEEGEINRRWYSRCVNANRIIGIDLGLRNIVTIGNNIGEQPIVIKGGVLKSINQFYNKRRAELQSIYAHQGVKVGSTMTILTEKRKCKIKDQMHKTSRCIIDYCIHYNISTIIIGHNDTWKQEYNSDVNGALNIIKKAIPNAFAKGIEDVGLHPKRLSVFEQKTVSFKGVC